MVINKEYNTDYQYRLATMARGYHARRWKDHSRLLREMSAAARTFSHCSRRNRTGALTRYVIALHQFTDQVVDLLPERLRKTVNARPQVRNEGRRRALRMNTAGARTAGRAVPEDDAPRLLTWSMTRQHAEIAGDALNLRIASELSVYLGAAGADRIVELAANNGGDLPAAAESVLRLFIGQMAAPLLVKRIVDRGIRA